MNIKSATDAHGYSIPFIIFTEIIGLTGLLQLFIAISFLLHIQVSFIHFPLAFIASILLGLYFSISSFPISPPKKLFIPATLVFIAVIIMSYFLSSAFYDLSWDGQSYHQETIIQLKNGWNPFFSEIEGSQIHSMWSNHYSKGAEIIEAGCYSFFNNIESGKSVNFFMVFAAFFLSFSFLREFFGFSGMKSLIVSIILCFNPIVIAQMFTFYIDGVHSCILICICMVFYYLFIKTTIPNLILFCLLLLVDVSLKFTAIPILVFLVCGFLVILIFYSKREVFIRVLSCSLLAFFTGLFIVGFNPYVTNTRDHSSPFYPIMGKGKIDHLFDSQLPYTFPEKNRFEKLFISLFAASENYNGFAVKQPPVLKIPFTVHRNELFICWDQRIAGMGVFFGGVILLATGLSVTLLLKMNKSQALLFGIINITLLVSILIASEAWWLRYVPQIWFIPFIVALFAEKIPLGATGCLLRNGIYAALFVNNLLIFIYVMKMNVSGTAEVECQYEMLKSADQPLHLSFSTFPANRIRFTEKRISFIQDPSILNDTGIAEIRYSNTKVRIVPLREMECKSFCNILSGRMNDNIGLFFRRRP